jgi:uncharacterized membrane protein
MILLIIFTIYSVYIFIKACDEFIFNSLWYTFYAVICMTITWFSWLIVFAEYVSEK